MDPGHLVDIASELRGIGRATTKLDTVRPWPRCEHVEAEQTKASWWWPFAACDRTRQPELGSAYVLTDMRQGPVDPIDERGTSQILGAPTRIESRKTIRLCR